MKRFCLMSVAVSALVLGFSMHAPSAMAEDYYANSAYDAKYFHETLKLPDNFSAAQLAAAEGEYAAAQTRRDSNLPVGWTEKDLCRSEAQRQAKQTREMYNLSPDFSEEDYAKAFALRGLTDLINQLGLPDHFTQKQLMEATARYEMTNNKYAYPSLPIPFSADQLQEAAGKAVMQKMEVDYHLSKDFSYAELKASAGPSEVAGLRSRYHLQHNATHDEMLSQAGVWEAKDYADFHHLPEHFTADQALAVLATATLKDYQERYAQDLPAGTEFNQEGVIAAFANHVTRLDREYKSATSSGGGEGFDFCGMKRALYDLDAGFTERDYEDAVGQSKIADLRRRYSLPADFNEAQLQAGVRRGESYRTFFDYRWEH